MVVSSTSMNVGTITAAATNQGLIAGRLTAGGESATRLMIQNPKFEPSPKSEARNPKSETNSKSEIPNKELNFPVLNFGLVSDFGFPC
jgi:hypothetical protein